MYMLMCYYLLSERLSLQTYEYQYTIYVAGDALYLQHVYALLLFS